MELAEVTIDTSHPTPPFEQLRVQLVALIARGILRPGDRLPTVRQLANDLGLAAGTVARAYKELERAGMVQSRSGAGTRVSQDPVPVATRDSARLLALTTEYVSAARALGVDDDSILKVLSQAIR